MTAAPSFPSVESRTTLEWVERDGKRYLQGSIGPIPGHFCECGKPSYHYSVNRHWCSNCWTLYVRGAEQITRRADAQREQLARLEPKPRFQREDPLAIRAAFYALARSLGQKPEFRPLPKGWAR